MKKRYELKEICSDDIPKNISMIISQIIRLTYNKEIFIFPSHYCATYWICLLNVIQFYKDSSSRLLARDSSRFPGPFFPVSSCCKSAERLLDIAQSAASLAPLAELQEKEDMLFYRFNLKSKKIHFNFILTSTLLLTLSRDRHPQISLC